MGEGEGIDFFIVISDLFQVGIVCEGGVGGLGMQRAVWLRGKQKPKSKIRLLVEVISKITDGSHEKFLRIPEYFVTFFAVLNCFDTLRYK
jgi:hypothetical protein